MLAVCAQASAQSINIDINNIYGTPTPALAAAGSAGTWNQVPPTSTGTALVDLTGAATPATMTRTSGTGGSFNFDNLSTTGDDQALLDDAQDPLTGGTWTIAHLNAGTYTVYTYGWAPDSAAFRTGISVNGGPVSSVCGTFAGYAAGVTHAVDTVTIGANGSIVITLSVITSFGTFNGVQIVQNGPPPAALTPFCFGDGTGTACPCGNNGAPGNGCASSVNAAGANLAGTGNASIANDTLSLNGSGMPATGSALYFQGTTQIAGGAGAVFGDGLRCAGGSVIRLGTVTNVGGASSYPGGGVPISIKGNNVAGNTRTYQCWYRNAAQFCNPETFNLTNGGSVTWLP